MGARPAAGGRAGDAGAFAAHQAAHLSERDRQLAVGLESGFLAARAQGRSKSGLGS